jgi:hypothetical protein
VAKRRARIRVLYRRRDWRWLWLRKRPVVYDLGVRTIKKWDDS